MAKPIAVTENDFEEKVLKSPVPVLVDFWAVWCGPCKMIAPVLEQVAEESDGVLTIAKVNVDDDPGIPTAYGVRSVPTLVLFKDGEAVDHIVGFNPRKRLMARLGKHVEGLVPVS